MMNWLRLNHIFNGRLARNLIFWLLFTWYHYSGNTQNPLHYAVLFFTLVISYGVPAYSNNFYLIPRFLHRRKYMFYGLTFFMLLVITTAGSFYSTWFVNEHFPGINYMGEVKNVALPYHSFPSMLMLVVLSAGKFTSDALQGQRKMELLEKEKLQSELQGLKSQLNPHFLFNALNTVYGMSRRGNSNTSDAILRLSEILRYVLYESNVDHISLTQEIAFVQDYVSFQNLRQRSGTEIRLQVTGETENYNIAPLLLLPFVENAIKHGPEKKLQNMWVEIQILVTSGKIHFECRNNYLRQKSTRNSGGLGLLNVQRRLDLLYKGRYNLLIDDSGTEFKVNLKLDLK